MIIWLNGTFGAGKTTTARHLVDGRSGLRLYDPETVGQLLAYHLPDHEFSDFQQLPSWRALVPVVADELSSATGQDLVAVQTVLDQGYWNELGDGLSAHGQSVLHVVLDADPDTLLARIDADPEGRDIRRWRHDHVAPYAAARGWLLKAADLVVNTGTLSASQAAAAILARLDAVPAEA